ncbi:sigma-70 family RNA polymerase sigma factor [Niastella sp. OAS944]|uniref:sigma-70 family RNA polymerase sigma factor n=1 Tax=Niastella sp. OAS944 TaxID=2664089 RepID=UPI00347F133E|nr:RNA polymerase sigma-70 factor (ECF subfamily) [Chitinophagaceae bacterium OAS944]
MVTTLTFIYQTFGRQLHNIVCKKIAHHDDCHDIMQEVYLKILLNINKVEQADNMAAYLVTLTNNTVIDHFRKSKPVAYTDITENGIPGDDVIKDQSLQLADCCLRPMIESLPDIYRDALVATELENMKLKDYAEKAGISLSNAKVRVQRAKEKLRDIIMQCCSYDFDKYGNIIECNPSNCCKK